MSFHSTVLGVDVSTRHMVGAMESFVLGITTNHIIGALGIFILTLLVAKWDQGVLSDSLPQVGYGKGFLATIQNFLLAYARHKVWVEEGYEKVCGPDCIKRLLQLSKLLPPVHKKQSAIHCALGLWSTFCGGPAPIPDPMVAGTIGRGDQRRRSQQ